MNYYFYDILKIESQGNYALYWYFLHNTPETIKSLSLRGREKRLFLGGRNLRGLDPAYFSQSPTSNL